MESTNPLSPAERIEAIVTYAEWQAYDKERALFLAERNRPRRDQGIVHGEQKGYKRGCRCDLCTKANTIATNEYRHRKGIHKPRVKGVQRISVGTSKPYPIKDKHHGTSTGYTYGCRCDECKSAHARAKTPNPTIRPDLQHGTTTMYRMKCRCIECRAANAAAERKRWNTRRKNNG